MTFSIVAYDPATGDVGIAVASHWFAVGRETAHVRPGVGALATQAVAEVRFGRRGLDLLAAGRAPDATLSELLGEDHLPENRQLAVVDADGRVAARTGSRCIPEAAHRLGDGYAVQGNLLVDEQVVTAMCTAYESGDGDLPARLLRTLRTGQATGGDLRGQQSAVMLVASPRRHRLSVDLRVDDHLEPLEELARLLTLQRAFHRMGLADELLTAGDRDAAARAFADASRLSGAPEIRFWHGLQLAEQGEQRTARTLMADLLEDDGPWRELLRRLPAVELARAEVVEQLLA